MSTLTLERSGSESRFFVISLVLGQLLTFVSTFFWTSDGRHSVNASTLIILSMTFVAAGLPGIFNLFKEKSPWYATLGLLYAMYGCIGGAAFGFEGLFSAIFHNGDKIGLLAHQQFPTQLNLVLFWAGPAFPLSMMVLGVMLIVKKIASPIAGIILIIAAIGFPVSRIIRIEWLAHVDDLLMVVAFAMIGARK